MNHFMRHLATGAIGTTMILSACASRMEPSLPNMKNNVVDTQSVEYNEIITALKIQIAQAAYEIKKNSPDPYKHLNFKTGNGTLKVSKKESTTESSGLSVVIPFSRLVSTATTPGLSGDRAATDTETETFNFSIQIEEPTNSANSDVGTVVRDAIISKFNAMVLAGQDPRGKNLGVTFRAQSIKVDVAFDVVKNNTGNVNTEILPSGDVGTIAPKVSLKKSRTASNSLSLTLPFQFADPNGLGDPARFSYVVYGEKGAAIIEQPYTERDLRSVIGKRLEVIPPGQTIVGELTAEQLSEIMKSRESVGQLRIDNLFPQGLPPRPPMAPRETPEANDPEPTKTNPVPPQEPAAF